MDISVYKYEGADFNHSHDYILPRFLSLLKENLPNDSRIFEIGFGNGAVANLLANEEIEVIGIDPSREGVRQAQNNYPNIALHQASTEDNLSELFGHFNLVYSLEVIEHVFDPYQFVLKIYEILNPGGVLILSTPYHGYLKNLIIGIIGGWDKHFTALWPGGHIKFWSPKTISFLLENQGFRVLKVERVGRFKYLAKSMIVVASKT